MRFSLIIFRGFCRFPFGQFNLRTKSGNHRLRSREQFLGSMAHLAGAERENLGQIQLLPYHGG